MLRSLVGSEMCIRDRQMPVSALEKMGELYGFGRTRNSEILFRFFKLNIKAKNDNPQMLEATQKFVTSIGRMKFVRPLYRELFKMQPALAVQTFQENELFYNPICRKMVAQDLGLTKE
eukprot:TRINITY_DN20531_c0_g1_i4.p1 TRINITY_DN20531_c0_g1~~TRINITY_DN20531_c0_g1_i4.p1  ORF type:complete len:133 (+),score=55.77 TRINITY_DN20531_c0_g1_i4:46-399(+)